MSETLLGSETPAPQGGQGAGSETPTETTAAETITETAVTPAETTTEQTTTQSDWMSNFQGEDLGWLQNRGLTGKTPEEALSNLVNAQRNAEKRLGAPSDRLLQLPADPTSEGAMDPVWDALGRPEDASGYELDAGDTEVTKQFADTLSSTFHENGVSKEAGEAIYNKLEEFFGAQLDAQNQQTTDQRVAGLNALQEKWGDTFDMNVMLAKEAVAAAGATKEQIDALAESFGENGDAQVIEFFNGLGQKRGIETSFVDGDNRLLGLGATTPEAARAAQQEMKADPKIAREILDNNPDNASVKRYRQLGALAAKMKG